MIDFGVRVFLVFGLFFGMGCAQPGVKYSEEEMEAQSQKINKFFDQEFDLFLERSPESLTYFGSRKKYEKLDDTTYQDFKMEVDLSKISLTKMKAFDRNALSEDAKISYDMYEKDILELDQKDRFYYHSYKINLLSGRYSDLVSFMLNQHVVNTEPEAWSYIARLAEFERAIKELTDKLKIQNEKGIKHPNFIFAKAIQDCKNIISGYPFYNVKKDSELYRDFRTKVARINAPPNTKNILMHKAKTTLLEKVKPSYQKLISVLEDLSKIQNQNNGVWALPDGEAYYQFLLNRYTTTNMTAQQVHKLGLSEVARIQDEMKALLPQLDFKGSLPEFFTYVKSEAAKSNPKLFYPNNLKGKQDYLNETQRIVNALQAKLPDLFNVLPKAKLIVKPVEKYREHSAGLAFYEGPAPDGSRPAIYYVNMANMNNIGKYDMEALAYHEAVPGHHMQIAIAQELVGVPKFRKYSNFSAYSEGWGLYAERLPKEIGFYSDPYSEFGRLSLELWRAARLVVDTGIHFYKWPMEKAIAYMDDNTSGSNDKNTKEIERYFVTPGQAVSYKVGQLKILELRERTRKTLGSKFDIKEFHDVMLKNGALPFTVLEKVLDRYVSEKRKSVSN